MIQDPFLITLGVVVLFLVVLVLLPVVLEDNIFAGIMTLLTLLIAPFRRNKEGQDNKN